MARLTAGDRKSMPKSEFAGPDRSFPVPDKAHARLAKAMAARSENKGNISAATKAKIDAKATKVMLGRNVSSKGMRGED